MQFEPGSLPDRAAFAPVNSLSYTPVSPPAPLGGAISEYLRAATVARGTWLEMGFAGSSAGGSGRGLVLVVVGTIVAVLAVIGVVGFLLFSSGIGIGIGIGQR